MTGCEALVGTALFACLARDPACLPAEHAHLHADLQAIMMQESGGRPYAVRDERTGESLFPSTHADAVRLAVARDRMGHTLGLGMFQITHRSNWDRHFGRASSTEEREAQIARALTPCINMRAGTAHYAGNLRSAAFQLYNSGRINGAPGYAASVMRRIGTSAAGTTPSAPPAPTRPPSATAKPQAPNPYAADTAIYTREMPHAISVD